ncbi:hypothetical protein [Amycolatopsis sp. lyj-112]|uniref:hypothetical protein n=1 Tax=Amycolatopsis sp. lyj-112 TaxID=2789288 RepID=UPI00397C02D5
MTDKEFTFDYRWQERLTLRDREDFERESGYAWDDLMNGGAIRTDDKGKILWDKNGDYPLRVVNMQMNIAFIYIVKRTDDPSVTINDIRDLPGAVLDQLMVKQIQMLQEAMEDAKKDLADQEAKEQSKSSADQGTAKSGSRASKK